ncbi:D-alanyl-D-alanine carboxypeptidase family protein [Longimycelium tulufanense]|nr:D-alanyl-D-alanine carboxypeptidase family protein [Longimycelium tulufanense]
MPTKQFRRSAVAVLAAAGALFAAVSPAATAAPKAADHVRHKPLAAACENRTAPPPPVDTSEQPAPGKSSPPPPPIPDHPVGGEKLGGCGDVLPAGAPKPPKDVSAASWLVADLDTGNVLAAHNPHARQRPASTIKVLTALTVLSSGDVKLDDKVTVSKEDAEQEETRVGLVPGQQYTVRQLMTAMLIRSGNDVAHALARQLGGLDKAVAKMNTLARELGALDTQAATPSGLDGPGQMTSAYDLALVFRKAMQNPDFRKAEATRFIDLKGLSKGPRVVNDNQLLTQYPGGMAGKTGFTDDARHTYIGAAERNGRKLVAVVLRTEQQPVPAWKQGAKLLDYGFALNRHARVGELVSGPPQAVLATTTGPAPQPAADPDRELAAPKSPNGDDSAFGTVGMPLTIAAGVAFLIVMAMYVRRKRAVARRRAMSS